MSSDLVPVVTALGGVLLGHLLSYFTITRTKEREWRLSLAKDEIAARRKLYAEFLAEAQNVVVAAMKQKSADLAALNPMNTRFAEITLLCPDPVIEAARRIADYGLTCHSEAGPKEEISFYRLKEGFIDAAKADIAALHAA
jgi:hypothetical protein